MKPDTVIALDLTNEELGVLLSLAQLGVKACAGEQFDVATASYVHLRAKIIAAQKAVAEAAAQPKTNDNVIDMEAAE